MSLNTKTCPGKPEAEHSATSFVWSSSSEAGGTMNLSKADSELIDTHRPSFVFQSLSLWSVCSVNNQKVLPLSRLGAGHRTTQWLSKGPTGRPPPLSWSPAMIEGTQSTRGWMLTRRRGTCESVPCYSWEQRAKVPVYSSARTRRFCFVSFQGIGVLNYFVDIVSSADIPGTIDDRAPLI